MAHRRSRRSSRQLDDLPGLFDDVEFDFHVPDPYAEAKKDGAEGEAATDLSVRRAKAESKRCPGIDRYSRALAAETAEAKADALAPDMAPGEVKQLQFISFGSGSSGNCAYIGIAGQQGLLIDAGVDPDRVLSELKRNCIPLEGIRGILLTHDHGDHVHHAYALLRKIPKSALFCTPRTLDGILRRHSVARRIKDYHKAVYKEFAFQAGPFTVTPFEVSHDGTDNVGFCITAGNRNFVVATDMGAITERADHYMRMANYLMIEANYDAAMLATGKYPEYLKARIRSDRGHLNNTVTADYLAQIWGEALTDIYLCHLSHDNNRPDIALRVVGEALAAKGVTVGDGSGSLSARQAQVQVSALPRYESSPLYIHRF